jgi:acetyl esterase/lipase
LADAAPERQDAAMPLWDDEMEALRPTLRAEADTMLASWPSRSADSSMPTADRVAEHRGELLRNAPPSEKAVDRTIPGPAGPVRVRTMVPATVDAVFLHIHGGGFVAGAPEMTDILHEILSAELNLAFVSVDYRLAPEHPYPAGPDDCEAAAVWLLEHAQAEFGASRLLIGGESAGAHLSACTLLRMRDRHDAIERFVGADLVFGIYDVSGTPSQRGAGAGPDILSVAQIEFFTELFTPGMTPEQRRDPDISPLYADLHDLVPAQFTVGTADHLVDDSLFMADRWELAGNRTERLVYPEGPHACIAMPTVGGHWFPRLTEFLRGCIKG